MMQILLKGLALLILSTFVAVATWAPVFWTEFWAVLAIAACAGLAAGALVSPKVPAWLAWIALIVAAWGGYIYGAINMIPSIMVWQFLIFPMAASTGVAAGLLARRMRRRSIGWRFAPVALCAIAVVGFFYLQQPLKALGMPQWHPEPFTMQLASGEQISSKSLAGDTIVLSFWATWCEPCRAELPALQKLYTTHYVNRDDVRFFVVNEDDGYKAASIAQDWLTENDVTLTSVLDNSGDLSDHLKTDGILPTLMVISPRGEVVFTTVGYNKEHADFPRLRAAIAKANQT